MSRLLHKILSGDEVLPSVMQAQSWPCFELEAGHKDLHGLLITQLLYKVRCSLSSMELGMSLKSSPGLLRTFLCSFLRVSSVLLQQHLYQQHPGWCQGNSGKTIWCAGTLPMGYRNTFTALLFPVLFTGSILSISFQRHLEILWALIEDVWAGVWGRREHRKHCITCMHCNYESLTGVWRENVCLQMLRLAVWEVGTCSFLAGDWYGKWGLSTNAILKWWWRWWVFLSSFLLVFFLFNRVHCGIEVYRLLGVQISIFSCSLVKSYAKQM